ncbi:hypothetical protein CDD82_5849 [Ophiocordyceps australis]|uniref:Uncharacterized protein n=1 Tax=Ophiocordyceps australis TaxID=1399860 RepID=A0A2C5YZ90_9HYPO|nr:hypothetical protein CDD82_5849 [Ophiocordyceps australis]
MKFSVISVSALAGGVLAGPLRTRDDPAAGQPFNNNTNEPSGSPSQGALLPWTEPGFNQALCDKGKFDEPTCGTQRHCKAYDRPKKFTDGKYENSAECLAAHEPNPSPEAPQQPSEAAEPAASPSLLPWTEPGFNQALCDKGKFDEPTCGTQRHCEAYNRAKKFTDGKYENSEECLAAHEPKPLSSDKPADDKPADSANPAAGSGLLPWVQPPRFSETCERSEISDANCGTFKYCSAYTQLRSLTDKKYKSNNDCLRAHEPDPSGAALPTDEPDPKEPKLGEVERGPSGLRPFKPPGALQQECEQHGFDETTCGTERYCSAYTNLQRFTDGRYKSNEECLADHEPNPQASN